MFTLEKTGSSDKRKNQVASFEMVRKMYAEDQKQLHDLCMSRLIIPSMNLFIYFKKREYHKNFFIWHMDVLY